MKITEARVIITCPGRNFVSLKICTDEGLYGVGDATLNGRELAVSAYLNDHIVPLLIGKDPHQIEDIWQFLYRGAYWRKGPVTMSAISAVDIALWDLKAKFANMPLYQLLGGKSRSGVMVYGHANGECIDETVEEVGKFLEAGYHAVRAQTGIPGLKSTYGVSKDKMFYEPADSELPTENQWSTAKYLENIPKLFEKIRTVYGNEPHLLHDVHHRLTPIEAASLGKDLESFRLFWLEDTVPAENQSGFRIIRQNTVTPLAVGEIFNIGGTEEISIRDLAFLVKDLTGSKSEVKFIPYEEAYEEGFEDMHRRVPSIEKVQNLVGYKPSLDVVGIISKITEYFQTKGSPAC